MLKRGLGWFRSEQENQICHGHNSVAPYNTAHHTDQHFTFHHQYIYTKHSCKSWTLKAICSQRNLKAQGSIYQIGKFSLSKVATFFLPVWELEPNLTLFFFLYIHVYIDVGRMCYSRIFTAGPTHCKRGNYKAKGCGLLPESQIIEFSTTRIQWHGLEET